MVGLPASGKSTWVAGHLAGHTVVSKDHWPRARHREARQRRVVADLLAEGAAVVVDNTNPSPAERAPLVELARGAGAPVRAEEGFDRGGRAALTGAAQSLAEELRGRGTDATSRPDGSRAHTCLRLGSLAQP